MATVKTITSVNNCTAGLAEGGSQEPDDGTTRSSAQLPLDKRFSFFINGTSRKTPLTAGRSGNFGEGEVLLRSGAQCA